MVCAKCGKENENQASVCASCGARLIQPGEPTQPRKAPGIAVVSRIVRIAALVTLVLTVAMAVSFWIGLWRTAAHKQACLSTVRQITLAALMYC